MVRVDHARVRAWRLRRHLLDGAPRDAVTVVRRVAGVQAQVGSCARDAVAVRGAPGAGLDAAIDRRDLVRTWAMRGTLHLLDAAGMADTLAVVGAARSWEKGAWQREFATADQVAALAGAADAVLADAVLTREELVDALEALGSSGSTGHGVPTDRLRSGWGTVLKPLAWTGVLCNGPPRGTRPTFTAPRTFVPGWAGLPDADDAASRVVPAYLAAHGPASPATFDAWLLRGSTPRARLRGWFDRLVADGVIEPVEVDGATRYARREDVDDLVAAAPVRGVRLLPGFDPWVLGPGTGDPDVVPAEHRSLVSRAAGWIAPVVLVDGVVIGTWEEIDGDPVVTPFPGGDAPPAAALTEEAGRWRSRHRDDVRAVSPPPP